MLSHRRFIVTLSSCPPLKAEELLSSALLPRKIELEDRYLQEALEILKTSTVSFKSCLSFRISASDRSFVVSVQNILENY